MTRIFAPPLVDFAPRVTLTEGDEGRDHADESYQEGPSWLRAAGDHLPNRFGGPVNFHAWVEGPAKTEPGEIAYFNLRAGAAGPELDDSVPDALATLVLSLRVSGDLEAFSSHTPAAAGVDSIFLTGRGLSDGLVLRDVAGMQNVLYPPPFPSYENPIHVLTFGVLTSESATGRQSLVLEDGVSWGPLRLVWYVNTRMAASDDPGNTLTVDPFSFRVIPAPAGVVLLALRGASLRRRRSFQSGNLRAISI